MIKRRFKPQLKQKQSVEVSAHEKLCTHSNEFSQKEVIKVTDGVWVAIGFGLANSIMIEGRDGLIIVDCMESIDAGLDVMKAFSEICSKPVVAIIYTHNHSDHITGARSFANFAKDKNCDIFAHEKTEKIIKSFMSKTGTIGFIRAGRQFGQFLPSNQFINCGLGPCLHYNQDTVIDVMLPTKTFDKELKITISGVELHLLHAPGETDDQIVVFLPQKSVLCAADNIYKAFPNLYAIRGTPTRDAHQWADSLDLMRSLRAEHLVPSHTRPLSGASEVAETIAHYRDGILFVHDQTVRLMNRGIFLDDIVPCVALPPHLANHPYLQEYYGTVAWGVRGVFNSYIGWFGGDPAHLHPLAPPDHASRLQRLAGGAGQLLATAETAMGEEDPQWALVCAQSVLRAGSADAHTSSRAKEVAVAALQSLAEGQVSANGRNYYLTYAMELGGLLNLAPSANVMTGVLRGLGAVEVLKLLPTRINPAACADAEMTAEYRFPDLQRAVRLAVRRGVAEAVEVPFAASADRTMPDLVVTVASAVFVDVACKLRSSAAAVLTGEMVVVGRGLTSSLALKQFMDFFDDSSVKFVAPI